MIKILRNMRADPRDVAVSSIFMGFSSMDKTVSTIELQALWFITSVKH